MEEVGALMQGFGVILTPMNIGLMFVGIILGVLIGVLPGLGGANGVAILLPLTFTMSPTSAIIMLSCIYWGALFGGAITSVLFNIPGEPWSVATTFDGYPMAQQGRAGEALTTAFTSSFVGALAGGGDDHLPGAAGREVRAEVRLAGILLGLPADLLQLRRHGQGIAVQDPGGDGARLRAGQRRHGHGDRPVAPDLRAAGADARLRLPDRGHRTVRHRRDPAVDGGRSAVLGQERQDRSEGGAANLEEAAALLGDFAAQRAGRHLDGHHARAAPRRRRS